MLARTTHKGWYNDHEINIPHKWWNGSNKINKQYDDATMSLGNHVPNYKTWICVKHFTLVQVLL